MAGPTESLGLTCHLSSPVPAALDMTPPPPTREGKGLPRAPAPRAPGPMQRPPFLSVQPGRGGGGPEPGTPAPSAPPPAAACTFADAPEPGVRGQPLRAVAGVRHLQDVPVVAGHRGHQQREAEQRAQGGGQEQHTQPGHAEARGAGPPGSAGRGSGGWGSPARGARAGKPSGSAPSLSWTRRPLLCLRRPRGPPPRLAGRSVPPLGAPGDRGKPQSRRYTCHRPAFKAQRPRGAGRSSASPASWCLNLSKPPVSQPPNGQAEEEEGGACTVEGAQQAADLGPGSRDGGRQPPPHRRGSWPLAGPEVLVLIGL